MKMIKDLRRVRSQRVEKQQTSKITYQYQTRRQVVKPKAIRLHHYLSLLLGFRAEYDCGRCEKPNSVLIKVKDLPETRCNNCNTTNRLPLITPPPREED